MSNPRIENNDRSMSMSHQLPAASSSAPSITPAEEDEARNSQDHDDVHRHALPVGTPPPTKKMNAASQFRSRRKRISHPLLDSLEDDAATPLKTPRTPSAGAKGWGIRASSTPPRTSHGVVTPDSNRSPESAALMDALKMAARPLQAHDGEGKNNDGAVQSSTTYASSIEAMAAHVEASHTKTRSSPARKTHTKPKTGLGRSDSSSSSMGTRKSSASSKASHSSGRRYSHPSSSPQRTIWFLIIPVLLSFLACEVFICLLVLRFRDSTEVVMGAAGIHMPKINTTFANPHFDDENILEMDSKEGIIDEESETAPVSDDSDSSTVGYIKSIEDDVDIGEGKPWDEMYVEPCGELTRLQSALEEGFALLSDVESHDESNRNTVDTLCGDVWAVANEIQSSKYASNSTGSSRIINLIGPSETRFDESQDSEFNLLKLEAQHCLGGAGMAFLNADGLDYSRLRVTTKVFDGLVKVEPYNPDARAGLGTSLLMQGIFYQEIREGVDDNVQSSLFSLAAHHLKLASLLSSSSPNGTAESGSGAPNAMSRLAKVNDENSASHAASHAASRAAILHNLALSHVALGDSASSVPILLRAAAMGREHPVSMKPYWNVPNDVLVAAEEKALLIGAMPKSSQEEKRIMRRIPFVQFLLGDATLEGR